jgi:hypothetical protein
LLFDVLICCTSLFHSSIISFHFFFLDFIGRVVIPMNLLESCTSTLCGWFDLSNENKMWM